MAKKQTDAPKSLNPFNESIVKIISASINYHSNGRCTLARTFRTVDGHEHTFTTILHEDVASKAITDMLKHVEDLSLPNYRTKG